jgi:hypothetical protein
VVRLVADTMIPEFSDAKVHNVVTENSGTVREFFQRRSSTNATVFGADYQNLQPS